MARGIASRRPKPTRELVLCLSGGDAYLLESWHNSQHDLPSMRAAYPHLDILEFAAAQVGAWQLRRRNRDVPDDKYGFFSALIKGGIPIVHKYKDVAGNELYDALNPYRGGELEARVSRMGEDEFAAIVDEFGRTPNEWLAEYRYRMRVRETGSTHGLQCAHWLPYGAGRKNGQLVPALAGDISRILRSYPVTFEAIFK